MVLDQLADVTDTAPSSRNSDASIVPMSSFGVVSARGVDAASFLQGQLTANIDELQPGSSTYAAHCNAKGRMYANFLLYCEDHENYLLLLPADNAGNAADALSKYAVFSKADIENNTGQYLLFGIPAESNEHAQSSIAFPGLGHVVLQSNDEAITWVTSNAKACGLATTDETWWTRSVAAGIGWITQSTALEFIPQMLNLDFTGGVSFDKGCYTGQEIVARMKFLGQVKRRMLRVAINGGSNDPAASAGQVVVDDKGKKIGDVVNVSGSEALLVLQKSALESATALQLEEDPAVVFERLDLPYDPLTDPAD